MITKIYNSKTYNIGKSMTKIRMFYKTCQLIMCKLQKKYFFQNNIKAINNLTLCKDNR